MMKNICCLSCRGVNWNWIDWCLKRKNHCCLSCRGVNWNFLLAVAEGSASRLPLMQRRELKSYGFNSHGHISPLPLMQRRELKFLRWCRLPLLFCCLSCRGVNWNNVSHHCKIIKIGLPLMQRRELKFSKHPVRSTDLCCLSCRGVNWNLEGCA